MSNSIADDDDDNDDADDEEDTIFALSSGGGGASASLGRGLGGGGATAVAVIRISGPCAFDVLRELLSPHPLSNSYDDQGGTDVEKIQIPKLPKARMASLRTLYDPVSDSSILREEEEKKKEEKIDSNEHYFHSQSSTSRHHRQRCRRDPLDSALVLTFPGPNSFTGQDIVELHCHGSRGVVKGVLDALSSLHLRTIISNASVTKKRRMRLRPADPGEFTQRAYAHGKLGLVEVEALSDLIVADTSKQRKQALQQFDGRLSRLYQGWRSELVKGLAHAEAVIDFGDDESLSFDHDDDDDNVDEDATTTNVVDDGGMSIWGTIRPRITALREAMDRHLADASRGELLRDGLRIAIVGRPNAGKSSLLNLLAGRDAAIVSSTPGTTRDVVEVILDLGGVRCTLLDTAGVREETEGGVNDIEVEGMRRARVAARDAHIIVGVVDASDYTRSFEAVKDLINSSSSELEEEGDVDDNFLASKNILYVMNKIDLMNDSRKFSGMPTSFEISCATGEGVENFLCSLSEKALSMVSNNDDNISDPTKSAILSVEGTEGAVITRARHRLHVKAATEALARYEQLSDQGYMALDLAAEELRLAASELGRVTGAIDVENILDVLFADFCIGK